MDNRHLQSLTESRPGGWLARARSSLFAVPADKVNSRAVVWWHLLLCAIAALNVVVWSLSAIAVTRASAVNPAEAAANHLQLLLCAAYVFGCAFRSVLPVYDIPRIVLVDSRLSSIIVGRSVATIAELCFAAQWALILHRMALVSDSLPVRTVSLVIVPLIVLAEGCSWYAVLTTAQRAHALENSIWGVSAALVVGCLLILEPHRVAGLHLPMMAWCVGGAAYVAYIFLFDAPAYWSRWLADLANGHHDLSIAQGVLDACRRRIVSYRWESWKNEMLWMSLYFTLGVWSSVSIVYASIILGAQSVS
ncbi:MAG TPA: hypothetical protein VIY90_06925 [Steroidobacteraceae bacterium]